jgi:predicted dehydrogenase
MATTVRGQLGVALIGAGAFGARRAVAVAANPRSSMVAIADSTPERARELAQSAGASAITNWQDAIARGDVDAVIVATPTAMAPEISFAALQAGKHVLAEKPFGRTADEVLPSVEAAGERCLLLKVGYNHRYHPALAKAHEVFRDGALGRLLHLRCVYGHGGRAGYEQEWRSRPEISGGGELLDQGVHALDLFRWFAGEFSDASAFLATSYWPIAPVEDNVFATLRTPAGVVAQLHASWTQWKNTFSFEVTGDRGTLIATGLGRSYGPERLAWQVRSEAGGPPQEHEFAFAGEDDSIAHEWDDFLDAIDERRQPMSNGAEAWRTLQLVDALYESAREGRMVHLTRATEPVGAAQAAGARNP